MSYDKQNIFARILRGEIPCNKVYEDEYALAFHDLSPAAPVHVLVIPKGEFTSFDDFADQAGAELMHGYWKAVKFVADFVGVDKSGYRLITNHGADAIQTVPHFHVHVLGKRVLGPLLAEGNHALR